MLAEGAARSHHPWVAGACLWAPAPHLKRAVAAPCGWHSQQGLMRYPVCTQQARNSVLATVTTQNQQNNYTVTPSFFWAPIVWCFHVPRTEGAPVPDREHLCPQPPAGVWAVFVPCDSAVFWQKNQVPKLTPFIGGWVALPPKAKVTIYGVKELVHQHIVLPLGYKNSLLLLKKNV